MNVTNMQAKLKVIGQEQVLRYFDKLPPDGQRKLAEQLASLDLDVLAELLHTYVKQKPPVEIPHHFDPVQAYPNQPGPEHVKLYQDAQRRGQELLKQGKIGAFLVAGGQGSRLGYEGPKGEYPVTPIKGKPLFQVFTEQLLAHGRDCGKAIPWYIMTSTTNDAATRAFFQKHHHFGYDPANVFFFVQGMMPAFSFDGKMLLAAKDSLALSPDGHGGSLRALAKSGALADMKRRGVEHLSYFQVDNPLNHCVDPLFMGLHDLTGSEMSSKTIPKSSGLEKVGNFLLVDGKVQVIEYSDLPESLALQKLPDGNLRFNAGSIAIHALRVSFVERLNQGGSLKLPWHRAEKKVPYLDHDGQLVKPEKPNAVKLEQFVFDAIPLADHAIVYTTDRAEEYSPVKNAEGNDSPASSKRDQIRRAAQWLKAAGVQVPEKNGDVDAVIEISPIFAENAAKLATRNLPKSIAPGSSVYLGE